MGAEEADGIEMDTVEFQGPGGGQFTIGEDVEEHDGSDNDQHVEEGKIDGQGGLGGYTNFEPQRHTDLT